MPADALPFFAPKVHVINVPAGWLLLGRENFMGNLCYNLSVHTPEDSPLILGFVADLIFAVKIEQAAAGLGFQVDWVEQGEKIVPPSPPGKPPEPFDGPAGALIDAISQRQPGLLIFDLGNQAIPWREWLPLLKSSPATRRIPLLCYGSHVDAGTLAEARRCGADAVLARSRFASDLPHLLEKYARTPDFAAIQQGCQGELSEIALRGLEAFNQHEFFEAHELLEAAWNQDATPAKELYRAILQVAVAYYQIERRNYNGAVKMFQRMRQWFEPMPDECRGVDVKNLRLAAEHAYDLLLELGRQRISDFDPINFRPVLYRKAT
jgi:CheY-like chemotaxis protein